MDHYIDIRLLPDPEFPSTLLMNALFAKLHRGLVEWGNHQIGVSFPEHDDKQPTLGRILRLHGHQAHLSKWMEKPWANGMKDHLAVSSLNPVPARAVYRCVYRVQAKSNPERLRRRWIKRKGLTETQAREAIPDHVAERLSLPYVVLNSQSTGQKFRLFIAHGDLQERPVNGSYSHYGLSRTATIPWF